MYSGYVVLKFDCLNATLWQAMWTSELSAQKEDFQYLSGTESNPR